MELLTNNSKDVIMNANTTVKRRTSVMDKLFSQENPTKTDSSSEVVSDSIITLREVPTKIVEESSSTPASTNNRRPSRRHSILGKRSSWVQTTDWDAMNNNNRASMTSTCSQMSGSQSSFYQVLDCKNEDADHEDGDGVGFGDHDGNAFDAFGDYDFDNLECLTNTVQDGTTLPIEEGETNEVNNSQGRYKPKRRSTGFSTSSDASSTIKVKRKSMLEQLMQDENSFSTSLASLRLSEARTSPLGSSMKMSQLQQNHYSESICGSILDDDFSSYFNDE